MTDNNFDQSTNNPQQNMPSDNGQPVYQQSNTQNGYQQQPAQNGYQQQPMQNGYNQQQPMQNGYNQQQPYQNGYNPYVTPQNQEKKSMRASILVLSIIGLVFSLLFPLVTYPCSIIGLTMANKHKNDEKTQPAIVMNIIALFVAVINSTLGVMLNTGVIN